ncbi:MAG: hypothetical protein PHG82_01480 [Candidatus Gracilibacteria bacterium]|nr:hypothetical protein [Candidatus Gracilibacteria bacterium]
MKKILIILGFLLFSVITAFAFTPILSWNNNIVECPGETDSDLIYKYGIPSTNSGIVVPAGSITCNTYYYYSYKDYLITYVDYNGGVASITACNANDRVIGWNTTNHTITCRKGYTTQQNINVISNDMTNTGGTNTRLKVSGLVGTKSSRSGLTANQQGNVKILNGNFDKAKIKSIIVSQATRLLNSVSTNNTDDFSNDSNISNFSNLANSSNYGGVIVGADKNIKLFKTNKVVTIGDGTYTSSPIMISGKKTIVISGGDLYINRDMYYSDNNSILGIIVMKDENGKGGNIFINPKVTNIAASVFAQYSVLSAEVTNFSSSPQSIKYYDGTDNAIYLRNQLYIYGSLFSENTIGGSISPYKCPYYVGSCTQTNSLKYDLNYLRTYFTYKETKAGTNVGDNIYVTIPYNNGKKAGGVTCDTSGTCSSGISGLIKLNSSDDGYSVVIKYNPNMQTNPPPLFSSN